MNRVHVILFPALLLGILFVIFFASLATTSEEVQAAAGLDEAPTAAIPATSAPATSAPTAKPTNRPATQAAPAKAAAQPAANCALSSKYPNTIRQWCDLVSQYARQAGLDANLIAAVMLQESGGNAKAYSSSGAVGLLQVMPRDGLAARFQCNGRPCFASRPSMAELYDPEFNISYGVRMLAGLVQKTGSVREALHSYGPMDVGYSYADKVLRIFNTYQ